MLNKVSVHKAVTDEKGCLSCHGNHTAKYDKLLIAEGNELCFSCHEKTKEEQKSKNTHAPFVEAACNVCHDPHSSNYFGMMKERMDSVCYSCHPEAEITFIKTNTHEPVITGKCHVCHSSHTADNEKFLKTAPNDPKMCLDCHGQLMDKMAGWSNHPLFQENKCLTCHDVHGSNKAGMLVEEQAVVCFSCHKDYPREITEEIKSVHEPFTSGKCTKCHNPHKAKLDTLVLADYPDLCLTCHQSLKDRIYKEQDCARAQEMEDKGLPVEPTSVICDDVKEYVHAPSELSNCGKCHRPHFSPENALITAPIQEVCAECHDYETGTFNKAHIDIDADVIDCRNCHDPHTSKDPMFFKDEIHPLFKARACEDCPIVEK